ncbi:ArsC/Spx/MgsR family protein [Bradyrhizobium amphicarpaeae]|uniref:Arsenate reductase family protein n=1 Tax=Bradyrhizobium amphicarpaeae TaxID=1404768 RepID=A0A2U8PLT1_9BRAD|nr:ArsC/Spx/MgsR family protein [Bradyrhizobium amphicarpaeae]AWL98745.1 arsenate reductase family protein [Bradyrhizobium amphicarpaeae]
MAIVLFFQKPGCGTNARQIRALEAAGHQVVAKSLLTEPWTAAELRAFFGETPVMSWFNPAAPRIKSGEVKPTEIYAAGALDLMLADPLLIRRPLIDVDGMRCAGFDREPVPSLLGGERSDLQGCTRPQTMPRCAEPR